MLNEQRTDLVVVEPKVEVEQPKEELSPKEKRRLTKVDKKVRFVDSADRQAFLLQDVSIEMLNAPCEDGLYKGKPMISAVLANGLKMASEASNPKDMSQIAKFLSLVVELSGAKLAAEQLGKEPDEPNRVLKIVFNNDLHTPAITEEEWRGKEKIQPTFADVLSVKTNPEGWEYVDPNAKAVAPKPGPKKDRGEFFVQKVYGE